jgi:hypothetical protein
MDSNQALAIARRTLTQEAEALQALSNALDDLCRRPADCRVPGIVWVTGAGPRPLLG